MLFQTTADIAEADRKRRQEFKEYEMQKEFEKQEKLKSLDDDRKQQMLKDIEDKEKKHKQHEPVSAVYVVLNIQKKFTPSTSNIVFCSLYNSVIYFGVTFIGCRSDCLHGSPGDPTVALIHTNKVTSKFKYGYQLCRFKRFRILHSYVLKFNPQLQYIHQPHSAGRFKIPILLFIPLCLKYSITNSYVVWCNTAVFLLNGYMFWLRSTIIRPKIQYLKRK